VKEVRLGNNGFDQCIKSTYGSSNCEVMWVFVNPGFQQMAYSVSLQSIKDLAPRQIYKPHLSKTSKHWVPTWIIKLTHTFLHCKKNASRGGKSSIGEKKMCDKSWILNVLEFSECAI
jgi:hypothetical protein